MGIKDSWDERVLPRLIDVTLGDRMTSGWREKVCGSAAGEVLEIGFGSGTNLPHYGPGVSRVLAVEPSDQAWKIAQPRIEAFGRPVERTGLDAAHLPLEDQSVGTVVSTWTLCTIPDLAGALAEISRVLRPDGQFHLVEHSLAPSASVARVQRTIQPVWQHLAGGCHVDRDIARELSDAGFSSTSLSSRYASRLWPARPFGWFVSGMAAPQVSSS